MNTTTVAPAEGGLRAARKEQAAARRKEAPAKKAAAKPTEPKPAAKAPAKQPASDAPAKLRWKLDGEKDAKNRVAQHADTDAGTYRISGQEDEWRATYTAKGGKPTVLAEGGHTKCYTACVTAHKATQ